MRKIKFVTTEAVLIAAVIAAVLRFWEIKTVFEPLTGLAKQYAFVSVLLVLLTVAVIGASVWYGIAVVHKGRVNVDPERPFPTTNKLAQLVCIVTGAIVVVGSAMNFVMDYGETVGFRAVFTVLGVLTGIGICSTASAKVRKNGTWECIGAIFMCFWLVMTYKENNTNPVLIEYCYECLGAAAATLSFYYAAGHYYGRILPKRTIITHMLGVYFCLLTTVSAGNFPQGLIFAALSIYQLIKVCGYIKGSPSKEIN